jgi:hypothetical protein
MDLNLNGIPEELKRHPSWVNWTFEERKGKLTKPPIDPKTNEYADTTDPSTWATYDQALKRYKECENEKIRGIGFVLSNGYSGADLDHCRNIETGEFQSWAREIITQLRSYTEITPSNEGIRVWTKGKLPKGKRVKGGLPSPDGGKNGKIEIYDSGRFYTVTGRHLDGTPSEIHQREEELRTIHRKVFGNGQKSKTDSKPGNSLFLSDADLINKAMEASNGDKFRRLWEGDISGYSSQSEADLALCSMLAFWTGKDAGRIDDLFRQSGPMREKWDEKHFSNGQTYGQHTINKAIEQNTEVYSPPAKKGVEVFTNEDIIQIPNKSISFPKGVITGVAGEFANLYSRYIEAPLVFLYFSFLCCLGSILSGKLILKSERSFQPRYYILLLGESADDRKSTAIEIPIEFFKEFFENALHICWGVGSAEGLQLKINENLDGRLMFCVDELKALLNKCKIDGSVLLPCLSSLFEKNYYEAITKTRKIDVPKAYLSILAASTIATYENIWTSQFIDIGFPNRIFIVPGKGEKKHPIPHKVPYPLKKKIADRTKSIIDLVGDGFEMDVAPDAEKEFKGWYLSLGAEKTVHAKRLDTYALRFMSLLAINDEKKIVDLETIQKVIKLMDWQKRIREEFDPIDATNAVAKMEEKIRRRLRQFPHSIGQLKHFTKVNRDGLWVFNMALRNLSEGIAKEVCFDKGSKKWELI